MKEEIFTRAIGLKQKIRELELKLDDLEYVINSPVKDSIVSYDHGKIGEVPKRRNFKIPTSYIIPLLNQMKKDMTKELVRLYNEFNEL